MTHTRHKYILIADDELNTRTALKKIFESNGFDVDLSADGNSALNNLIHHQYDIVVIDLMMPKKNGDEVIREVNRNNVKQKFILVTAYAESTKYEDLYEKGLVDFINKPFRKKTIIDTVNKALNKTI